MENINPNDSTNLNASESSTEDKSTDQDVIKRQKSNGPEQNSASPPRPTFPFGVAASPPRFVAIEEVMKAANGVSNMYLAHEIAVDEDFRLGKPQVQGLRGQVEDVMKQAFWDVLQSQLNESPPKYKQALSLLREIKDDLLSLLLPQHTKLKQEIHEILDIDLVRQQVRKLKLIEAVINWVLKQAENGALDFPRYAQYVLSVMARLCAPVRDDKIRELTQTNDVVMLFR